MWSSIFWTFFLCFLPSPAYTAPAPYPNALALINDQPDLTIISTLIKRDNVLVDLYTNVRDVTIFAAPDNTFPSQNLDVPPFTDKVFVRAILQQIIAEGVHPTTFTPKPKYYKSALTNPDFVNLSLGAASTRLVKLNGQNNFLAAGGLGANVLESGANIPFTAGLLHKLSNALDAPSSILQTAAGTPGFIAPNYSLLNASAFGLLDALDNTKDVTVFALTNEAFSAAVKGFLSAKQCPSESILKYLEGYAVVGGVYYGDRFDGRKVKTLSGESVRLSGVKRFPELRVDEAKVVLADVFVRNGVVHVLDRPIFPSS